VYGMSPKIVKCLLEHGADPNAKFNGYSAWSNARYYVNRYSFDTVLRRGDIAAHALHVVEVMKLLLAYGAAKKASCKSKYGKTCAAEVVHTAIDELDNEFPQEVRDGLREVLLIIKDDKVDRGRVNQAPTPTIEDEDGEDRISAASFAGSSRPEPQSTSLPFNASLSQRIKARLLKRRR
jgi:hypothetical protein